MKRRRQKIRFGPRPMSLGKTQQARKRSMRRLFRRNAPVIMRSLGELKGVDIELSTIDKALDTVNTNTAAMCLNLIAPGTGSYNRVGRKVRLKSLRITGAVGQYLQLNGTTGNFSDTIGRLVVVWDKQPTGAIATFDAIFGVTDQNGTESTDVYDSLRFDNTGRFRVIKDMRLQAPGNLTMGGTTIPVGPIIGACTQYVNVDEFIKLPNLESVYSGQTVPCSVSDISSGALLIFFRAANNTTDVYWQLNSTCKARLRYTD